MFKRHSKEIVIRLFASQAALGASRIMGHVSKLPVPGLILRPIIRLYSAGFGVDTDEYAEPSEGFSTFGEFFGRRLRPDARTISREPGAFVSPCDGNLTGFGDISTDNEPEFLIKQSRYSLSSLLGSAEESAPFKGGQFAVIYLHPRDYHRVHAPLDLALFRTRHIPGARYSVASWCDDLVDGIYDKNERVVFNSQLPNGGSFALIMVAAFGVGNITTEYDPGFNRGQDVCWQRDMETPVSIGKGDELGAFLLGSTVVMVWSQGAVALSDDLQTGPLKMGRLVGKIPVAKNGIE